MSGNVSTSSVKPALPTVAVTLPGPNGAASMSGSSLADVLTDLDQPDARLIPPPTPVPWAEAKALIEAIPSGEGVAEPSRWMDIPGAANGIFAVGVSAFQELHDRTREEFRGALRSGDRGAVPSF